MHDTGQSAQESAVAYSGYERPARDMGEVEEEIHKIPDEQRVAKEDSVKTLKGKSIAVKGSTLRNLNSEIVRLELDLNLDGTMSYSLPFQKPFRCIQDDDKGPRTGR